MKYRISEYCKVQKISRGTVYSWKEKGIISMETDRQGRVWVIEEDPKKLNPTIAIYTRSEEKEELEKQKERLLLYCSAKGYIVNQVVEENIGLDSEDTPELEKLLLSSAIDIIVTEGKDRISLSSFGLISKLLESAGRKIEVTNLSSGLTAKEKTELIKKLNPTIAIYTRSEEKEELEKQKERLLLYCSAKGYIVNQVVEENIGLDSEDTPELEKLLLSSAIDIIVTEGKDRISLSSFGLISKLLESAGRKIEVTNLSSGLTAKEKTELIKKLKLQ